MNRPNQVWSIKVMRVWGMVSRITKLNIRERVLGKFNIKSSVDSYEKIYLETFTN